MKFGIRTPSIKKSVKARTTGRVKRMAKKATNPLYGKKGVGFYKNPKKAVYNKAYNKTTTSLFSANETEPKYLNNFSNNKNKDKDKELSASKLGLGLFTCGVSLLFTGIHKDKK